MKEFQFLHLCNHEFKNLNSNGEIREIDIVNNGRTLIDLVVDGAILLGIMEVRVMEYESVTNIEEFRYDNIEKEQTYEDIDPEDGYYDDDDGFIVDFKKYFNSSTDLFSKPLPAEFYSPFLHNRIKWNVKPPKKYKVKATILFPQKSNKIYRVEECPRCQGKGWFVDILDQSGRFQTSGGIARVAQKIIKNFLTKLHSSVIDTNYGTVLFSQVLSSVNDDTKLFEEIRLIVSEIEDNYLAQQRTHSNELLPSETLLSLRVRSIQRSSIQKGLISLELVFRTENGESAFRFAF